jgi:hypothetical protein
MPYSTRDVPGTPYVFVRLFGDYGLDDAREMLRELTLKHVSLADKRVICDVRDGYVHMSWQETFQLAQFFRDHGHVFAGVRWSVIVPRLLEFGIARTAGLAVVGVPFDYNVSQDPESACHWAGVPVEMLDKLDALRWPSECASQPVPGFRHRNDGRRAGVESFR